MSKYICILALSLSLLSCKNEKGETPKVRYDNSAKEKPVEKVDDTPIKVADLPINFSGTNYLIHPVGDLNIYGREKAPTDSALGTEAEQSFKVSNNNDNELTGYLQNLKFQEVGSDSIRALTTKPILIETVTYLKSVADKSKKHFIVYTLSDADTNKDGKVDNNDIKTLYLSDISGNNFIKLSADFQELIDWSLIESKSRIYFRVIEDINKNGAFDKEDKVHYHYLDLLAKELKVQEYNPVN